MPVTGVITDGSVITFEYTDTTKNGRVSTYMNKVDVVGGQQTAQQTQQRVSTPPNSKDRQIFIQGVFQQMCMGAASGQVSESTLDGYFKAAEKYWLWFNNPSPMKPGDAPQNSDSNGYDSGRY